MKREELTISTLHDIAVGHLDQIGQEISEIENLLTERRLYRKWIQDPEGADLFSEDLAQVEAKLEKKEGQRETLLEEYNRYERKLNWLKKQLEILRFRSGNRLPRTRDDDYYDLPFSLRDDDIPF